MKYPFKINDLQLHWIEDSLQHFLLFIIHMKIAAANKRTQWLKMIESFSKCRDFDLFWIVLSMAMKCIGCFNTFEMKSIHLNVIVCHRIVKYLSNDSSKSDGMSIVNYA